MRKSVDAIRLSIEAQITLCCLFDDREAKALCGLGLLLAHYSLFILFQNNILVFSYGISSTPFPIISGVLLNITISFPPTFSIPSNPLNNRMPFALPLLLSNQFSKGHHNRLPHKNPKDQYLLM